jgi:hypothetical protein
MSLIGMSLAPARRTEYSQANGIHMCIWGTRDWYSVQSRPFLGVSLCPRRSIGSVEAMSRRSRCRSSVWHNAGFFVWKIPNMKWRRLLLLYRLKVLPVSQLHLRFVKSPVHLTSMSRRSSHFIIYLCKCLDPNTPIPAKSQSGIGSLK